MEQATLDEYVRGGERLKDALVDVRATHLDERPGPGAWSIRELVAHLYDADSIGVDRMRRVIAMQHRHAESDVGEPPAEPPTLLAYDQDAFVANLPNEPVDVADLVSAFDLNRRVMAARLRALPASAFKRVGLHSEDGVVALEDLVRGYVEHLEHHLKFLREKRARLGG